MPKKYTIGGDMGGRRLQNGGLRIYTISIKRLDAWQYSVAAHTSQISTFWPDVEIMREEITKYHSKLGGVRVWDMKN
jgi:hypothetical protein